MFAQAALCLSGRACPGLENLFLMLYREYRYSIEKKEPRSVRIPVIYSGIQIQLTVLFYFCVC